jgi:hypothetical protein
MKIFCVLALSITALVLLNNNERASGQLVTILNNATAPLTGPLSGVSYPILLNLSTAFGYPVQQLDAFLAKVLKSGIIDTSTLGIAYNALGQIECGGVDGDTGLPILKLLVALQYGAVNYPPDFGGDYLCYVQCPGGSCAPYNNLSDAPISAYPFGCNCNGAASCDANGPKSSRLLLAPPAVEIRCDKSPNCNCGSLNPGQNSTQGYLCNWWNVALDQPLVVVSYPAVLSAIRWCTCCANQ